MRRIRKSGLADMMQRYTFEAYETPTTDRAHIKAKAVEFAALDTGWYFIAGRSGSGKSHICTAICAELIKRGQEVYCMSWRDESTALKAAVNDPAYKDRIGKLKTVPVLYIDDFFKGGCTPADVKLAFEILNARYLTMALRTIISSEMTIRDILSEDEALGGRIYERSRGFVLQAPDENWRLK